MEVRGDSLSQSRVSVWLSCSLDCPQVQRPVLLPNKFFSAVVAREKILELLVSGTAALGPGTRGSEPSPLPWSSTILSHPNTLGLHSPVLLPLHLPSPEPPSLTCLCPFNEPPPTAATFALERLSIPSKHRVLCLEVFNKGIPGSVEGGKELKTSHCSKSISSRNRSA